MTAKARTVAQPRSSDMPDESFFGGDDVASARVSLQPTASDPFRGLNFLVRVAILGAAKIRELASRPVDYLWADIAISGIIVMLAGGPGSGKTTLLFLVLCARLNVGEPVEVLGRLVSPAPAGRFVVLIEGEHGDTSAARKLVKSCAALGVPEASLDRIILVARQSVKVGGDAWGDVERLIAAGLVSDVALDTLARVSAGDANDESVQVAIFDNIARAIELAPSVETRPVVWVVAHTRKGEATSLDDVSGSTQRTGQADTVLLVNADKRDGRVTSSKVVFAKLREEPDEWPAPVEYTVSASGVTDIDAPAKDERPLEERVLDQLALGPKTKNALCTKLGRNAADIDTSITNLFAARHITTTSVTVGGKPRRAFSLRDGGAA